MDEVSQTLMYGGRERWCGVKSANKTRRTFGQVIVWTLQSDSFLAIKKYNTILEKYIR